MYGSVVDIQSPTAENRRGKKKKEEERKIETTGQKYNGLFYALFHRAAIIMHKVRYISRESLTTRNVLYSRASVCLSVCPRRAAACLHYCADPDVTWGCPLVVHYWTELQSMHGLRCYVT